MIREYPKSSVLEALEEACARFLIRLLTSHSLRPKINKKEWY